MDFVNTCEQMTKAYAPFYTATVLANSVSASLRFSYDSGTDEALLSGLEQNQDFFFMLLNDDELKKRVLGIFEPEIYKALRDLQQ